MTCCDDYREAQVCLLLLLWSPGDASVLPATQASLQWIRASRFLAASACKMGTSPCLHFVSDEEGSSGGGRSVWVEPPLCDAVDRAWRSRRQTQGQASDGGGDGSDGSVKGGVWSPAEELECWRRFIGGARDDEIVACCGLLQRLCGT